MDKGITHKAEILHKTIIKKLTSCPKSVKPKEPEKMNKIDGNTKLRKQMIESCKMRRVF